MIWSCICSTIKTRITELDFFVHLSRRLSGEALAAVLEDLRSHGHLEWTDKSRRRCHIYYRTPEEWGSLVYAWAREGGMTGGAVCTFYEITEGDDAEGQPFRGLDRDTLVRALKYEHFPAKIKII